LVVRSHWAMEYAVISGIAFLPPSTAIWCVAGSWASTAPCSLSAASTCGKRVSKQGHIGVVERVGLGLVCLLPQRPPYQGVQRKDMAAVAPRRRPFRPHFMHLFRLVLTRSRAAECRKANHFLAHLALLVGPEALSRPATAQKSLGRGPPPPPRPPLRRCAAPWLGYAQPKTPKRGGVSRITSYGRRVQLPCSE
jgi:hypothetical protein